MIRPTRPSSRRGTVLVLTVISLTALLVLIGITLDGGMLLAERRQAQAAADAAALAGAADLYKNYAKDNGADTTGSAEASAVAIANANGYDAPAATIETRVYGETYLGGPKAGLAVPRATIEVTITYNQPRYFSSFMGSGPLPVVARAVAAGSWKLGNMGLLALDPSGIGLKLGGNAVVDVQNGAVVVNSTNDGALTNSSNTSITAAEVDITGGSSGGGTITTDPVANNMNYGVPPTPDPLAYLPEPNPASLTTGTITEYKNVDNNLNKITDTNVLNVVTDLVAKGVAVKNVYVLDPGIYGTTKDNKLPVFNQNDVVVFRQDSFNANQGIYYLADSGFTSTMASLVMYPTDTGGIMFFNAGPDQNDSFNITGNPDGVVNLVGLADGIYKGLLFFQSRSATESVSITGNGDFNMVGSFYAPNAELRLAGNGTTQTIGAALIAKNVTITGNGQINVNFNSGQTAPVRTFRLIE